MTCPNVADAIAIGIPDERRGEIPVMLVQQVKGHKVDLEELEQVCRSKLSRFKVPKAYYVIDEIPRTKNRKPDRKRTRKMFLEGELKAVQ